jgi:aspartate dehydrogenase
VRSLGLIGFGGIGRDLAARLTAAPPDGYRLAALLVRPYQLDEARAAVAPRVLVTDDIAAFLAVHPQIVVEAAGQGAMRAHALNVLKTGADLVVISTGALADTAFRAQCMATAEASGVRILIPVGAIAGLDGLLAMRQDGLHSVTYTSTKPPQAWKGTPAEANCDLDAITQVTTVFEGSAAEAALNFPKNANLAATVALAGLGLTRTRVRLVADPQADGNTGRIDAQSESSQLTVIVAGRSSATNPKTSAITGMSVLSALANRAAMVGFI